MIIGLGQDMCNIERIEQTLARFGERFTSRVFTALEIEKAEGRRRRAETYAKRFAAKEACAKALGTGVPRAGVHWRHMGVVNLPSGRPSLALTSGAAARLAGMTPAGHIADIRLTITDDWPWAQALVIIEAHPGTTETQP